MDNIYEMLGLRPDGKVIERSEHEGLAKAMEAGVRLSFAAWLDWSPKGMGWAATDFTNGNRFRVYLKVMNKLGTPTFKGVCECEHERHFGEDQDGPLTDKTRKSDHTHCDHKYMAEGEVEVVNTAYGDYKMCPECAKAYREFARKY